MLKRLAHTVEKCKPGTLVIVVSHVLKSHLFELLHTAHYRMTWGVATGYIYRRKKLPRWVGTLGLSK